MPMKYLVTVFSCILAIVASLTVSRPSEGIWSKHAGPASVATPGSNARRDGEITALLTNEVNATHSKLVWFFGSSIDNNAVTAACQKANAVVRGSLLAQAQGRALDERSFKYCTFGDLTLVFSMHPGATPPPYSFGYPSFPTTQAIATKERQRILEMFGKAPDAIVVDSSIWDMATWWTQDGSPGPVRPPALSNLAIPKEPTGPPWPWSFPHAHISNWCHTTIPHFLDFVQETFPQSQVALRTPPTVSNVCHAGYYHMCQGDEIVDEMYQCLAKDTHNGFIDGFLYGSSHSKYHVIDYHAIAEARGLALVDPKLRSSGLGAAELQKLARTQLKGLYMNEMHPGADLGIEYIAAVTKWAMGTAAK